jgi:Zn-dependent protease with chaperone function
MSTRFVVRRGASLFLAIFASCALGFAPSGYAQTDLNDIAAAVYQRGKDAAARRGDLITSGNDYERLQHIAKKLIAAAPEVRADSGTWAWEVAYIHSAQVNALCFPGGKIVVFSGLVDRLSLTDDEFAAVMGHEISHALLDHQRESYNQHQIAKVAVGILGIIAAIAGAKHHTDPGVAFNATTAVGTVGAEFLALRPYSREREIAADKLGAELAARAGFDPRGAITLHEKFASQGTGVIEFLSTHPASETRLQELAKVVPADVERFASRRNVERATTTIAASEDASATTRNETAVASAASVSLASSPQAGNVPPSNTVDGRTLGTALAPQNVVSTMPVDPDAVIGAKAASMPSKYMINAERYAKSRSCLLPIATMVIRAPTYESFDVKCSSGSQLAVRCESGDCQPQE